MGKHVWDSQAFELVNARKVRWPLSHIWLLLIDIKISIPAELLYMVSTCVTKVSILLFYRRLAAGTITRGFQWSIYAAIAFVVAYFIGFFINMFLICKPFSTYWLQADYFWLNMHRNDFTCQNEGVVLVISAAISALQDFIACGLPMILLWKLHIPRRQKWALGAIFSVGLL